MKTSFRILALVTGLVLFAACAKEQETAPDDINAVQGEWDATRYLASFGAANEVVTKADVDFSNGTVTWNTGDLVLACDPASGDTARYQWDGSKFAPVDTPLEINGGLAYAYFPADCFSVASDGTVSFTMPECLAADPGNKLPMAGIIPAGQTEGTPVCYFKQMGSMVWVKAKAARADGEVLTKVRVVNTSLSLTGTGTLTWDGTGASALPQLGELMVPGEEDALVAGPKAAACVATNKLDNVTDVDYYIFVPAGNLEGLELQFVYGKGSWNEETGAHDFEPYQSIQRNSAFQMGRGKVLPVHGIVLPGYFSGGDGSEEHPYVLSSLEDLETLSALSLTSNVKDGYAAGKGSAFANTWAHYKLTDDVDFDGVEDWVPIGFDPAGSANTGNGTRASNPGKTFRGTFDGQNHEIQNFTADITLANGKTYGFFGALREATVKNLKFTNVDVTYGAGEDANADAGILAGTISFGTTVENITIEGNMTSEGTVTNDKRLALGGIAGFAFAKVGYDTFIKNCDVTLNITGGSGANTKAGATGVQAGSIVGFSTVNADASEARVTVENCVTRAATIDIKCGRASGLVAAANIGTIMKDCVNYANITNDFVNGRIGALVCMQGINSALIDCENRGNLTTTDSKTTTGGMVALIQGAGAYIEGGGNYGDVTSAFVTDGSGRNFYGLVGANLNNFVKIDGVTVSGRLFKKSGSSTEEIAVNATNFIDNSYIGWWNNAANKAKITNCTYVAP